MNYTFINVPTPKKSLPKHDDVEFESLSSYLEQANRLISHYCKNKNPRAYSVLSNNEDAVSLVAHALMMADWTYDVSNKSKNGSASKNTYRYLRATWAMKTVMSKSTIQRLRTPLSLDISFSTESGENSLMEFIEDFSEGSPSSRLETQELRHNIQCLLELGLVTETQKQYLVLRYLNEMELDEIAQFKGVTRQAVYDGLKRAKRFLREGLNLE
tara:strand:+ start:944 stop:1585 length:642 start_codon:yes stop_codon:yes gene_type:complete